MNKHTSSPTPPLPSLSFIETLGEHRIIQWISEHGKFLAWGLLALITAIFLIYRLLGGPSTHAEKDYFQAENDFTTFRKATDPKAQEEALDKLAAILKRRPELQSKYDGLVAQLLLDRNQVNQALTYANRTASRTGKDHLPLYANYAQNSLLISEKKYPEALKQTLDLQQQLIASQPQNDTLLIFNMLRIPILHQQLGNKIEELKAWQQLKQLAAAKGEKNVKPEVFETIINQLRDGNVSLLNYIETREQLLSH